jgi:hypothetical protein
MAGYIPGSPPTDAQSNSSKLIMTPMIKNATTTASSTLQSLTKHL